MRNFGASLTWTGETGPGVVWPRALGPGARVGLFAPAHHFDREEMRRGAGILRSWGLEVAGPEGLGRRFRYLAGDDHHRLAVFSALMEDESVDGLMAVRGGYGCQRLLPHLADRWAGWPAKPIYGFSDLTALHLARLKSAGVVGFHAPMAVSLGKADPGRGLDAPSRADLKKNLLEGRRTGGWTFSRRAVLRPGRARGPLWGGNLTLVASLLAGPWLPEVRGAVVMLEEVDEPGYRLDRLLTVVRQSPVWAGASALVFGRFARCGAPAEVTRLLKEAAADFPGPVLAGAPFGHLSRNRLFPLGALAEVRAE